MKINPNAAPILPPPPVERFCPILTAAAGGVVMQKPKLAGLQGRPELMVLPCAGANCGWFNGATQACGMSGTSRGLMG